MTQPSRRSLIASAFYQQGDGVPRCIPSVYSGSHESRTLRHFQVQEYHLKTFRPNVKHQRLVSYVSLHPLHLKLPVVDCTIYFNDQLLHRNRDQVPVPDIPADI